MKKNQQRGAEPFLPRTSASDLRGRQSVRATFRLTERAIGALNIVSIHLGIKQKSLFDHLMEDAEALETIARSFRSESFKRGDGIQKTYVLSRKTLRSLDQASKNYNTPRDALVEYSIQRLMPVIVRERQRHLKRKRILSDLSDHVSRGLALMQRTRQDLGADDPVYEQIEAAVNGLAIACENIEAFVEKGKVIEEF